MGRGKCWERTQEGGRGDQGEFPKKAPGTGISPGPLASKLHRVSALAWVSPNDTTPRLFEPLEGGGGGRNGPSAHFVGKMRPVQAFPGLPGLPK